MSPTSVHVLQAEVSGILAFQALTAGFRARRRARRRRLDREKIRAAQVTDWRSRTWQHGDVLRASHVQTLVASGGLCAPLSDGGLNAVNEFTVVYEDKFTTVLGDDDP